MEYDVYLRYNHQHTKANGCAALYLHVKIGKDYKPLPLSMEWPPHLVDEEKGHVLPRKKDDPDANDNNIIIRDEKSKANEIFKQYRLSRRTLTMTRFLWEYQNFGLRHSFTEYMKKKIDERERSREITSGSGATHRTTLQWLVRFKGNIPFADLDRDLVEKFQRFMKRSKGLRTSKVCENNTIARNLRTFKAYINLAIKDNYAIENPFATAKVRCKSEDGQREQLLPTEYQAFVKYYRQTPLPMGRKLTLLRFLISCNTGLRLSDLKALSRIVVNYYEKTRQLTMKPKKTQNTSGEIIYIPLDDETIEYMQEAVRLQEEMRKSRDTMSDQRGRDFLKEVAQKNNLDKKVTFHVGRHTFATNYLRAGGRLEDLQDMLGHYSIETTMIYRHIVQTDVNEGMSAMKEFMNRRSA